MTENQALQQLADTTVRSTLNTAIKLIKNASSVDEAVDLLVKLRTKMA